MKAATPARPAPSSPPGAVWDWFTAVVTPAWVADWYATHGLTGGGGIFSPALTLWLLLTQRLNGRATGEAAWSALTLAQARQLSPGSRRLREGAALSPHPSGYAYARQRLPLSVVRGAADLLHADLRRRCAPEAAAEPPTFLLDGSTLTLAHTPALARAFPPAVNQHGESHWPVVRIVVAHALDTGLAVAPAWGAQYGPRATSEQALARAVLAGLDAGAWVVADRNFGVFSVAWEVAARGQVPLVRLQDSRARKVLGAAADLARDGVHDGVVWEPSRDDRRTSPHLPAEAALRGRVVVRHVERDGGRQRLCLFTTDLERTPAQLLERYGRRWDVEVDLRSLKHGVALESTGVRSPELFAKDLLMAVAAYNVLRWVAAAAAREAGREARRMSFTRTLHYVRAYAPRLERAAPGAARERLWSEMLEAIAAAPLPQRDRKGPPRHVWRRPQAYAARRPPRPG